jgi:ribose/xylose/arabinose/galactoside ABC-type transport system permease subunit
MADSKLKSVQAFFGRHREISVALILALELMVFYLILRRPGRPSTFINAENLILIFKYSGIYGIAAIGASMIIISGGIDLAPGAVIALTTVVTGFLFISLGLPLPAASFLGLMVGVCSGLMAAFLVTVIKLPPFIATLGVMGVSRGLAFIITQGQTLDLSAKFADNISLFGINNQYWPGILMVALALVFHLFMVYTAWGRQIHAVGGNEVAAYFSGVKVRRIKVFVYLAGGILASLGGVLIAIVHGQGRADIANGYELDIIAASVVGGASLSGGKGSVLGAVLGSLIFGVLRNGLSQITGLTFYERLIVGLVVVVIVIIDQLTVRKEGRAV